MKVFVSFKNPDTGEIKQVECGWNWVLFSSVLFLGTPLFDLKLKRLGIIALLFFIVNFIIISGTEGSVRIFIMYPILCITMGFQVWLGIKGSEFTAKNYLKRNWSLLDPESELTKIALRKWGIYTEGAASVSANVISSTINEAPKEQQNNTEIQQSAKEPYGMKDFLKVCLKLLFVGMVIWACEHLSAISTKSIRDIGLREAQQAEFLKNPILPTCNSDVAKGALIEAVKNSPAGKTVGLEIFDIKNIVQHSYSEEKRVCSGVFYTNAGDEQNFYSLTWIDKNKGEWYIKTGL